MTVRAGFIRLKLSSVFPPCRFSYISVVMDHLELIMKSLRGLLLSFSLNTAEYNGSVCAGGMTQNYPEKEIRKTSHTQRGWLLPGCGRWAPCPRHAWNSKLFWLRRSTAVTFLSNFLLMGKVHATQSKSERQPEADVHPSGFWSGWSQAQLKCAGCWKQQMKEGT